MHVKKIFNRKIAKKFVAVFLAAAVVLSNSAIGTLNVKAAEPDNKEVVNVQEVAEVSGNDVENAPVIREEVEENNSL